MHHKCGNAMLRMFEWNWCRIQIHILATIVLSSFLRINLCSAPLNIQTLFKYNYHFTHGWLDVNSYWTNDFTAEMKFIIIWNGFISKCVVFGSGNISDKTLPLYFAITVPLINNVKESIATTIHLDHIFLYLLVLGVF